MCALREEEFAWTSGHVRIGILELDFYGGICSCSLTMLYHMIPLNVFIALGDEYTLSFSESDIVLVRAVQLFFINHIIGWLHVIVDKAKFY